ncbi:FAD-dependent oxidoreductase [Arthrobacter sp. efr-133-TYG-118]|uniref:NAD(P)/FAD-dependent oxidoreductase n=1 Tax=Arthrobacter sp. efr-133-TYG-118 TaxID=3040279 RepID=UPI00254F0795|nr:FAD-dependent oxidoreductase [Arthrobacter sp. efr-133-TYG-118]
MNQLQHIAIIGASAAGVAAAGAMRRGGFDGTITLHDGGRHLPYERPPLSKSAVSRGLKEIQSATSYAELEIELLLGQRAVALTTDREVIFDSAPTIRPDRVLLATGVSARRLPVSGAELHNVLYLRDAGDAEALSAELHRGGPLVLVGGGFIGLEIAAVARTLGIDVTVVETQERPLFNVVGPEVGGLITALHHDRGVRIITGREVTAMRGSKAVEEVVLSDGRVLPAATVVVGVGVVPNDQLVRTHGVKLSGGVVVDAHGQTDDPWIWAAGDVAVRRHRHLRRVGRIEHWDTAQRHGATVGSSMVGDLQEDTAVPYVWSDQYELSYQAFGRGEPTDQVVLRDGAQPDEFLAFSLSEGRVHAVAGINRPRDVRAGRSLVESGATVSAEALRDPATNLRRLPVLGGATK